MVAKITINDCSVEIPDREERVINQLKEQRYASKRERLCRNITTGW